MDRVRYYSIRMRAVQEWKEEKSEERREEAEEEAQQQHGGSMPSNAPANASMPSGSSHTSSPSQAPEGWTQEEWDHVPQSLRGDVASGQGMMDKEAIQDYIEAKDNE